MTLSSICPKCGRPSQMGLCDQCRLEVADLLDCPDHLEVVLCSVCGAQLRHGKWIPTTSVLEDLIFDEVDGSFGVHKDLENYEVTVHITPKKHNRYQVIVNLDGEFLGLPAQEECRIPVTVRRMTCDRCSRMAGNYYEATIQIRGSGKPPFDSELEESKIIAQNVTEKNLEKGNQFSFIQDIKVVRGGLDIVLGSTQQGRRIAKALLNRFGGKTQESYKLMGKKDGKNVYRTNILVRFPRFRAGDVVKYKSSVLVAEGFEGKRTIFTSIDSWARVVLSEEDVDQVQILGNRSQSQRSVVVAGDVDVLDILDPDSYQTISISRPRKLVVGPGQDVDVIRLDGHVFVLPPPRAFELFEDVPQSY